jgi:nucleoside-triphosphatase THEP1
MGKRKLLLLKSWDALIPIILLIITVFGKLVFPSKISLELLISTNLGCLAAVAISILKDRGKFDRFLDDFKLNKLSSYTADTIFSKKSNEGDYLKECEKEIWLLQETGSLIGQHYRLLLIRALQEGKIVKMVLPLPNCDITKLMSLRNDSLLPQDIQNRADAFSTHLASILNECDTTNLEIRYIPYPIDITAVFIDPNHKKAILSRGLLRYASFRVDIDDKIELSFRESSSPRIFDFYKKQVYDYYLFSYKVIFITGPVLSGKSTLFQKIYDKYKDNPLVYIGISKEIIDSKTQERVGFEYFSNNGLDSRRFATKIRTSKNITSVMHNDYEINLEIIDQITEELYDAYIHNKTIIFDEIGPMQFKSESLRKLVYSLTNSRTSSFICTIHQGGDEDYLTIPKNSRCMYLSIKENPNLFSLLDNEVAASIKLNQIIGNIYLEPIRT